MEKETREGGFTLIEMLAVTAILTIISVPLLGLFSQGFAFTAKGQMQTTAVSIAREVIENEKAKIVAGVIPTLGESDARVLDSGFGSSSHVVVTLAESSLYHITVTTTRGDETITLKTLVFRP